MAQRISIQPPVKYLKLGLFTNFWIRSCGVPLVMEKTIFDETFETM